MNRNFILFTLLLAFQVIWGQTVDFKKFTFNGLPFTSSKKEIIKTFGKPKKEYNPNYDCSGLSTAEQGVDYYTLDYGAVKFTGNETEKYVIDEIDFSLGKSFILYYGKHKLTRDTTFTDLKKIFGNGISNEVYNELTGVFLLWHGKYDEGLSIEIKDGKLIKIGYWSPC